MKVRICLFILKKLKIKMIASFSEIIDATLSLHGEERGGKCMDL